MSRFVRTGVVFLCLLGFLFVRFRESELFYDPLISFFKGYYHTVALPEMNVTKLALHMSLRYSLLMILSLLILWMVFLEKEILKFAVLLYVFVFVVLLGVLLFLIHNYEIGQAGVVFYVRRFLIQPLLIFILLPAFFYYRKVKS